MAVKRITAWQTSSGQAFGKKSEAYHEEMVWLVRTRGELNKRGFDVGVFDENIAQQQQLADGLKELREGLSGKQDSRIIAELDRLCSSADEWLKDASKLRSDMDRTE